MPHSCCSNLAYKQSLHTQRDCPNSLPAALARVAAGEVEGWEAEDCKAQAGEEAGATSASRAQPWQSSFARLLQPGQLHGLLASLTWAAVG